MSSAPSPEICPARTPDNHSPGRNAPPTANGLRVGGGATHGPAAQANVASLAQVSFVAFLLGPPLPGYVAEYFGIRWSFGIRLPLVILSIVCVGALGAKSLKHEVE
jgi:MFS family permease